MSLRQCRMEVAEVEALYCNQIPWINSTNYLVEEIATRIPSISWGLAANVLEN